MSLISHLPLFVGRIRIGGFNLPVGDTLFVLVFCVISLGVYLLPAAIAVVGKHPAALGIAVLNIALGWTGIVWIATFIWACIKPKPSVVIQQSFQGPPALPARPRLENELEALQRLREKKLISEEEFCDKRRAILDSM